MASPSRAWCWRPGGPPLIRSPTSTQVYICSGDGLETRIVWLGHRRDRAFPFRHLALCGAGPVVGARPEAHRRGGQLRRGRAHQRRCGGRQPCGAPVRRTDRRRALHRGRALGSQQHPDRAAAGHAGGRQRGDLRQSQSTDRREPPGSGRGDQVQPQRRRRRAEPRRRFSRRWTVEPGRRREDQQGHHGDLPAADRHHHRTGPRHRHRTGQRKLQRRQRRPGQQPHRHDRRRRHLPLHGDRQGGAGRHPHRGRQAGRGPGQCPLVGDGRR